MTKVDKLVREKMLTYPTLYPSRAVALYNLFTDSGSNYVWKKGCLVATYKSMKDFEGPIDISDLAKSDERWADDSEFSRTIRIENELERRNRLYRAEHIDLLCQFGGRSHYGYQQLDNYLLHTMEGAYGVALMYLAPFGKIDPEWAHTLEKFVADMFFAFNRVYRIHFDNPLPGEEAPKPSMYSQMPADMRKLFDNLRIIADRLEAQTGSKAKAAAFWKERGTSIMKEIVEEDA